MENAISAEIHDHLNKIDTKINDLLIATGSIIAGSFVLKYILKHNNLPFFEPNDIDIFVPCNNKKDEVMYWFHEHANKDLFADYLYDHDVSYYTVGAWMPLRDAHYYEDPQMCPLTEQIKFVNVVKINGILFNIIELKDIDDPMTFVEEYFDLEFCKCTYDGTSIHCNNMDAVLNKKSVLNPMGSTLGHAFIMKNIASITTAMILKYEYSVRNKILYPDTIYESKIFDPLSIISRIIKYEKRGFIIDTSNFKFKTNELKRFAMLRINLCIMDELKSVANQEQVLKTAIVHCNFVKFNDISIITEHDSDNDMQYKKLCVLYFSGLIENNQ